MQRTTVFPTKFLWNDEYYTPKEVIETLRRKYGDWLEVEFGPGRIAEPRNHVTIGLTPSADPFCDIYWDLNYGLPFFPAESIDRFESNQVLEHLLRLKVIQIMNEQWRTLSNGGVCEHCVPIDSGIYAWSDPTHQTAFGERYFEYFCVREDGTKFVEQFSDYGISCAFTMVNKIVRPQLDIKVLMRK